MSLTLGEKLRQAREERGISLSEVAEQTRISKLYIESIENDDYRGLPGGIFNKGFIKSFAKYVGVDEQEALQDYTNLTLGQGIPSVEETKTYRPEVLTDDRSSSSSLPTIILAVVILGLGTIGVLFLLNYFQRGPIQETATAETNSNTNVILPSNTNTAVASTDSATSMNNSKIEFKALKAPVSVSSTYDDKRSSILITPEKSSVFEPKQNLRLSYSKSQAQNVQLVINGKPINLPTAPANPNRNVIELEITNANFKQIWDNGAITSNPNAATAR